MFYSLKETADKLGRTEDEVKQLAKEGKLREFRDGSNLLFKIDEVEALLGEGAPPEAAPPEEAMAEVAEPEASEPEPSLEEDALDLEDLGAGVEGEEAGTAEFQLDEEEPAEATSAAEEPEEELDLELVGEAEGTSELGFAPEADETSGEPEAVGPDEEKPVEETTQEEDEILLAPESGMLGTESDITDMDTALTGEGVSVLGETDTGYDVTEDSMAETVGPAGTSTEASLEEIEDDVNLDSFGSGSGLLDLSLQADDTSLGGILDEIYTAEGGEEGAGGPEPSDVEDMTAEAEHVAPEEELAAPEPVAIAPTMAPTAYVEAPPDTQSNMLGMLLFLPLAALLYTTIVTVAAQRQVMPSILGSIQGMIWYIMAGAAVVAGLVVGASFVVGGEKTRTPKARKEKGKKEKKAKKEKPKKEKKAKPEKPKKEKKPLFGKKKKG
jgi:hypothetical protein